MRMLRVGVCVSALGVFSLCLGAQESAAGTAGGSRGVATPVGVQAPARTAVEPTGQSVPKTYGTTATSYQRISSGQFTPSESTTTYSDMTFLAFQVGRYPTAGTGYFISSPTLPSGALVSAVEFAWCDTSPGSQTYRVDSSNVAGQSVQELQLGLNTGAPGCGTTVLTLPSPFTVDNLTNQLFLLVNVPPNADGSKSFSGAIVHYQLQVSPAPAVATFNDVPTSDLGFQYIEALAASGITGGCGGGDFCPDNPVTRRQMAIFISKALGLQWP
jgi:S-layer homology domain